ncbi:MAG: Spy/CpxP family protein refolding chaperone [bacterium]|nr:Spy/CpxP family protein refolding chaperone [bacterium]
MKHHACVTIKSLAVVAIFISSVAFAEDRGRRPRPPRRSDDDRNRPRRDDGPQKYSIEQACGDRAQLHTIAFSGVAFLTGEFGASTFIPPGKVCDYFGFQYMRDIDIAQKGHNPIFLNRVAGNVLHILNDEQKQKFLDLAKEQAPQLEALARMRLPLVKAFHMTADAQIPARSKGLNQQAVEAHVAEIFAYDMKLSIRRAEVMAEVYRSLTDTQTAYLDKMKFGDFNSWPEMDERGKLKRQKRGASKLINVAYMTYASEFFSWVKGSVKADVYFCPERHGTYFGGFYMKDMPIMGKRDQDISTSLTGESGEAFIEKILTSRQSREINAIPAWQKKYLAEMVTTRRAIATELRKLITGKSINKKKLMKLGENYGRLDGRVSWRYTTVFAAINRTLTKKQQAELVKLRNLTGYKIASYYIYSRGRDDKPDLSKAKTLFFPPTK